MASSCTRHGDVTSPTPNFWSSVGGSVGGSGESVGGDQQVYLSRRRGGLGGGGRGWGRQEGLKYLKQETRPFYLLWSLSFLSLHRGSALCYIFSKFYIFLLTTTAKIKVNLIMMFWIHLLLNPLSSFLGCLCFGRLWEPSN